MPLVTLRSVLADARGRGYAVGAFNFNGIEDARGVLDAAVQLESPVVLMTSVSAMRYIGGAEAVVGYIKALAKAILVPVVLHLDHAQDFDTIAEAVDAGYTSVMIDASRLPYEENISLTRRVADYAHHRCVSVEAELGMLGGREESVDVCAASAAMTNPDDVPGFVFRTGIDALAVAVGTAHGFYKAEPRLDFQRLERIHALTEVPLVLHGGTGVPEPDFIRSIKSGICKINIGTELKNCCSQTIREYASRLPGEIDVRKLAGPARENCREIVLRKLKLFGSVGRA